MSSRRPSQTDPSTKPLKPRSHRQPFSEKEDDQLKELVAQLGNDNWRLVADQMENRTARQCRERYRGYLAPSLTTAAWMDTEDDLLRDLVSQLGPKWSQIAARFPGRSEVQLKNRWFVLCSRARRDWVRGHLPPGVPEQDLRPSPAYLARREAKKKDSWMKFGPDGLLILPGLDVRLPEEGSEEAQIDLKRRERCFPNHGGDYW
jgi:hypothetical protein